MTPRNMSIMLQTIYAFRFYFAYLSFFYSGVKGFTYFFSFYIDLSY